MSWHRVVILAARRIPAAEPKSRRQQQQVRGKHWLAVWGNGDQGRLGLSTANSQWEPTLCSSLQDQDPVVVACGGAHTLVLTGKGHVFAMGLNDYGQLGLPFDTAHCWDPIKVGGLPSRCVFISAGYHHSAAVSASLHKRMAELKDFVSRNASNVSTILTTTIEGGRPDGAVYVWGSNSHGQLGLGKRAQKRIWSPQRVDALKDMPIKILALGSEHSLGLTEGGEVLSWGSGQAGQLGHGQRNGLSYYLRTASEYYPRLVDGLRDIQCSAALSEAVLGTQQDTRNSLGQVHAISAGFMHSACVDQLGNLFTFGQGRMCQLGHGDNRDSFEPVAVTNLPLCTGVACGGYHTGAISRNGDLYMWGSNEYGCLGFGWVAHLQPRAHYVLTEQSRYRHANQMVVPLKVDGVLARFSISEVSCGWKHTCALTGDGKIYAWGWGGSQGTYSTDGRSSGGQLGLGDEFDYNEPTLVMTNRMHALHISCGFNHTAAILRK